MKQILNMKTDIFDIADEGIYFGLLRFHIDILILTKISFNIDIGKFFTVEMYITLKNIFVNPVSSKC